MMLPYDLAFTGSRARRRQRLIHKPLLFGYRPLGKSPPCVSPRRVRLDPSLRPAGRRAAGRQYRRGARHGIFQGHRPNQGGRAQRRRVGSRGLRCGRRQDGAKDQSPREKLASSSSSSATIRRSAPCFRPANRNSPLGVSEPSIFFLPPWRLIYRLSAQADYGDKWPS